MYGVRAAESRGCASHLSLAAVAGHPPRALTKGYIYMCRRDRRRAIVGDIIVSGVTAIGTCERAAGEENVGHFTRGCH